MSHGSSAGPQLLLRWIVVVTLAVSAATGLLAFTPIPVAALTCRRVLPTDFTLRSWDDPSQWDCRDIPGPGDRAILPKHQPFVEFPPNLDINRTVTLAQFEMHSGRIQGNHIFSITHSMIWSGGNLHYINTAPFFSPAATVIGSSATLTVTIDDLTMSSTGTITNAGTIEWIPAAAGAAVPTINGGRVVNLGEMHIETGGERWDTVILNQGLIHVAPSPKAPVEVSTLRNEGTVALQDGLSVFTYMQFTGTTILTDTQLIVGTPLQLDGGKVEGRGEIVGGVNNRNGKMSPTSIITVKSANTLAADLDGGPDGDLATVYNQAATGTLALTIKGTQRGVDYGSLNIRGTGVFSGTLNVTFTDGFTPDPDDGFILALCATACTGQFLFNNSGLPIHYNDNYIVIGANIPLPDEPKLYLPAVQSSQ